MQNKAKCFRAAQCTSQYMSSGGRISTQLCAKNRSVRNVSYSQTQSDIVPTRHAVANQPKSGHLHTDFTTPRLHASRGQPDQEQFGPKPSDHRANTSEFSFTIAEQNPLTWHVIGINSQHYAISQSYRFQIVLFITQPLDPAQYLGKSGHLTISGKQHIHGDVKSIRFIRSTQAGYEYQIILSSPWDRLIHTPKTRVFRNIQLISLIQQLLRAQHIPHRIQVQNPTLKNNLLTQWQTTDAQFLYQLLAEHGWFFGWQQTKSTVLCIITDTLTTFNHHAARPLLMLGQANLIHDKTGAWSYQQTQRLLAAQTFVSDHPFDQPELAIDGHQQTHSTLPTFGKHYVYGTGATSKATANQQALCRQRALDQRRQQYQILTNAKALSLGQLVQVANYPPGYIIAMHIQGEELSAAEQQFQPIQQPRCTVLYTLIPTQTDYASPLHHPVEIGLQTATIAEPDSCRKSGKKDIHDPPLDQHGRYTIRYPQANKGVDLADKIVSTQPYATSHGGWHFPLHPHTPIALYYRQAAINRPIIAGVLPNTEAPSPVTHSNPTQHIIRSFSGHQLCWEDQSHCSGFRVNTAHQTQCLVFKNDTNQGHIDLTNQTGNIVFQAAQQFLMKCGQDWQLTTQGSWKICVQKNYHAHTQTGHINWHTEQECRVRADQHIFFKSGDQIAQHSAAQLNFHAKKNIHFSAHNQFQLHIQNKLKCHAKQTIALQGKSIHIRVGASSLQILGDQCLLQGSCIVITK